MAYTVNLSTALKQLGIITTAKAEAILKVPRLVGTRGVLLKNGLSNGTDTQTTYRQKFAVGVEDTSDLRLIYANWHMPNTTETPGANTIMVRASVEYPSGTFHPLFFSGRRTLTLEPGAQIMSDALSGICIPAGAQAWVRTHVSVASVGEKWPLGVTTIPADLEGNVAGADRNDNGTVPNVFAYAYGPLAIMGTTRNPTRSVAMVGDSIMHGQADTPNDMGFVVRAINGQWGWTNLARASEQARHFATSGRYRTGVIGAGADTVICNYGSNDINANRTVAQIKADLVEIWRRLSAQGAEVYQTTITPRPTSTDTWKTLDGQTPHTNDAVRREINEWLRTLKHPFLKGVMDVTNAVEQSSVVDGAIVYSGKWMVNGTNNWMTNDGVHPSPAAHLAMSLRVVFPELGAPEPTLVPLSLSTATTAANVAQGSVLAEIQNKTSGSTLEVVPADPRFTIDSRGRLIRGTGTLTPGDITINIREVLFGSTNSPKTTQLKITVTPGIEPLEITGAFPAAKVGQAFNFVPTVTGGVQDGSAVFTLTGTLPSGLVFAANTGAITGTPTQAVTRALAITVSDASGSATLASQNLVVSALINLAALTLSATTVEEGEEAGVVIGSIQGKTTGSTITLVDDDGGRFALQGNDIVTGATAVDFDTRAQYTITLRETLAGAENTPRNTLITITATNVLDGATLNALALSDTVLAEDSAEGDVIGILSGMTAGSTLSISPADARVALQGANLVTGSQAAQAGTFQITVRETLADSPNSPRDTQFLLTVEATAAPVEEETVSAYSASNDRVNTPVATLD